MCEEKTTPTNFQAGNDEKEVHIDLEATDPAAGIAAKFVDPKDIYEFPMDKSLDGVQHGDIESDSEYKERGIMDNASWLDVHAWVNRNITLENFWDYRIGNASTDARTAEAVIGFVRNRIFDFCNRGIEGSYCVGTCEEKRSGDFGWALGMLKMGYKVRRGGWNGKGMYLWLLKPSTVKREWVKDPMLLEAFGDRDELECLGSIRMFTADKKVLTGWLASQTDMLAEDWEIVEEGSASC